MKKHTNTVYTNEVLNNYLNNDGVLNIDYFVHCVEIVCYNHRPTNELIKTTRKARNVAIEWLMYFINTELEYIEHSGYYATNKQVMQWDRNHGGQLEKVLDILERYINDERNEK